MKTGNAICPMRGKGDPAGLLEGVMLLDCSD